MTATVFLTTYLPPNAGRDRPVRRRRKIAVGDRTRIRPMTTQSLMNAGADIGGDPDLSIPTLLVDGKPVAYLNHYSGIEWNTVAGDWWGTGIEIVTEPA